MILLTGCGSIRLTLPASLTPLPILLFFLLVATSKQEMVGTSSRQHRAQNMTERIMTSSASFLHRNRFVSCMSLHVILTSVSMLLEGDGTVDTDFVSACTVGAVVDGTDTVVTGVVSTGDELDTAAAEVLCGKKFNDTQI